MKKKPAHFRVLLPLSRNRKPSTSCFTCSYPEVVLYLPLDCLECNLRLSSDSFAIYRVPKTTQKSNPGADWQPQAMSNKKGISFGQRAAEHPHPLAKKLFQIAERKKTNIVLSADLATTKDLLAIVDGKAHGFSVPR